jgi:hypothetical protein
MTHRTIHSLVSYWSHALESLRLAEFVEQGELNLNDFTAVTHLSCQQSMSDLMKVREVCRKNMRTSGHHSNDFWTYCTNNKHGKVRESDAHPLPPITIYYCHVLCLKHPGVDGKFCAFLAESLKSGSTVDMTGNAGDALHTTGGRKKAVDAIFETLTNATSQIKEMQQQSTQRRTTVENVTAEGESSKHWDEYIKVVDKFTDILGVPAKLPLLRVLAIRIRKLEKLLGIPADQSVLQGVDGIPLEVMVSTVDIETASDVTTRIL